MILVIISVPVIAGTRGKISGTVIEKSTGNPLIGVNIVIENTDLGGVTDKEGNYFILNVPVGLYSLQFSFIGYRVVKVKSVNVIQDLVTEINVEMESRVIDMGAVEVVAQRPLIHKEVSSSTKTISSDEFKNLPVESVASVINNSAGVASGNYIRGSRNTEVSYMVDGISLTNPINGGMLTDISKNAVDEIVLQTGGFSAEYGNAMGGVVNVVTKEGGPEYQGSLRYKTDKINSSSQFYRNANIWDITFGGPLIKKSRFFLTTYLNTYDMNPGREVIAPDGTNIGRHPHQGYQEYRTNLKFSVPITPSMKLKVTGSVNRSQGLNYSLFWRFGEDENQLDRRGAWLNETKYGAIILDHTISSKTFYTLKAGITDWHSINGQRDRSEWSGNSVGANCDWWKDFTFRKPFLDTDYHLPGDTTTYSKWRLRDSQGVADVYSRISSDSVSASNPYGISGGIQNTLDADYFDSFIYSGDNDWYAENRDRCITVKFDLTSQFHKSHEIKTGFELKRHNVNRFAIGNMAAYNGIGVTYPMIDFYEESPSDTALSIQSMDDLGKGYQPVEFATYLNYQFQLKNIFVNLGLRFDYFNTFTEYRIDPVQLSPSNPFLQDRTTPDPKYQLSPRLGISFPVTERTMFRFNYGYFFQTPPLERMFAYLWFDRNQSDMNMGNPDIEPQKTISYEVGLSTVLTADVALDVTIYQKNMFNLEGYRIKRVGLNWFFQAFNEEYAESKGLEMTLRKRLSHYFGGSMSYTFAIAEGTSSDVTQITRYPLTNITYAKQLGYEPIYPQDTMPMNFDQRHTFNLNLDFYVPPGEGPSIFRTKLLSGFGTNIMSTINSGRAYTPITSYIVDVTTDRFNSARYPWTYIVNSKFYKDIKFLKQEITLHLEVYNLLNLQRPSSVYEGSGDPDKPMYNLTLGSLSGESYIKGKSSKYSEWSDFNKDGVLTSTERLQAYLLYQEDMLNLKSNYPNPRTFTIGVEIKF
ncbi:MAG: TonB-dependent receptor [archaeon]